MKNINWKVFFNHLGLKIRKHSPEILTGLGITGMITTTVLAVKATPEAMRRIEKKKEEEHHKTLTVAQTVQAAGSCYIPAVVTGAASIACLVGASAVNDRRNAALATAYGLAETSLREYKERVVETIGEQKEAMIQEKVDSEQMEKAAPSGETSIVLPDGNVFCKDSLGKDFYSNKAEIERVVNLLNRRMTYGGETYVSLNELYEELGAEDSEIGELLGWNVASGLIEISFGSTLVHGHIPCLMVRYRKPPIYDYDVC